MNKEDLKAELNALKLSLKEKTEELEETRYRLEEANDTIEAIRSGEVDALVIRAADGHQLYTLKSSDQTYRIFIEQMTTSAVTLNGEGNILYCNSRFAELLKLPLEKVIGKSFGTFVPDTYRSHCSDLIHAGWESEVKSELKLRTGDDEVPVLLSLQALNLDEGPSMSVIITDLTEQKQYQQLLEEKNKALEQARQVAYELNSNLENLVNERTRELYNNQERLSRILETMAEGVGIIDLSGKLTYANPMAQQILGLSQSAIQERTYHDPKWENLQIDGSPLPHEMHPMSITLRTGKPVHDFEIAVQPPGRERFYISINAAPLRDENGNITGGVGTFMDVTNRRKAIQQKDEFISVASHELKTPLTSLKASLQLLSRMKEKPDPVILPKLIDQSNKSLMKVSLLVDELLNATKLTEGHLQLQATQITLKALINDCCPHIRHEGSFELIEEGDLDLEVNADINKLEQVLVNLVNNAVKYAPESKQIRIRVAREGSFAKIMIIDRGRGVPPEKLPHLFDRYYRVDTGGHQYSGLGLGLYISNEIVKRHGGTMGVESELEKGSTFWFTLPLNSAK
ncbi:ATP-binding protein [Desertivirga brevis]|uniref:ATP-binding protein n=1 Tax=Desertivirga brevis TaxID=2810310 RepID=UPI001A95CE59|nr:ATP-binding protein [Pedobacter sp. SYSU D00873]